MERGAACPTLRAGKGAGGLGFKGHNMLWLIAIGRVFEHILITSQVFHQSRVRRYLIFLEEPVLLYKKVCLFALASSYCLDDYIPIFC
jgi:hypothetical protein